MPSAEPPGGLFSSSSTWYTTGVQRSRRLPARARLGGCLEVAEKTSPLEAAWVVGVRVVAPARHVCRGYPLRCAATIPVQPFTLWKPIDGFPAGLVVPIHVVIVALLGLATLTRQPHET